MRRWRAISPQPPFALTVWNRTRARADAFARDNTARVAATPAEAARGAAFVVTCLPTSREVEIVLDGADGVLAGMERGSMLIDSTSGDPATSRRIAARLGERGIAFIDAPVSGGTIGAETRNADRDVRRRCGGVRAGETGDRHVRRETRALRRRSAPATHSSR